MSLSTAIRLSVAATLAGSADLESNTSRLDLSVAHALATGTGASQADKLWSDQRTLAPSAADALDLAGGITDALGATVTLVRVKGLLICNDSTSETLTVGAGANPWITWLNASGDAVKVAPGGTLLLVAPDATAYAVTAGTGDTLTVTNSGGAATIYRIVVVGASA
jgi:hypothetical protein